jgi:aminoglycoside phosphotransferase (APT) family kinase protein
MKTTYTIKEVGNFLNHIQINADIATIIPMAEGHTSQVFRFQTHDGKHYVFRIRTSKKDLLADQYAYNHFSKTLPVPAFIEIGQFDIAAYYCVTEYIQGDMLNTLNDAEFQQYLPAVRRILAKTFQTDISKTSGYGDVDFDTGNAHDLAWKDSLKNELSDLNVENLRQSAKNINLPDDMVDKFVKQFNDNLPYVSETRRLLHGDPGGDNVLVNDGKVVALLDWEQMAYGDWMRDFSRFSFWEKNSYGDALEFANEFDLEAEHIKERTAVYWAINALRNIEFADIQKSEKVAEWMRIQARHKLVYL